MAMANGLSAQFRRQRLRTCIDCRHLRASKRLRQARATSEDERARAGKQARGGKRSERGRGLLGRIVELPEDPIGGYVSSPRSFLHSLDPRTKQAWLAVAVLLPARLEPTGKLVLAGSVALAGLLTLPRRVALPRLRQTGTLALLLLVLGALSAPDDAPIMAAAREGPAAVPASLDVEQLPALPEPQHKSLLAELGPLRVTRRSVALGLSSASLAFVTIEATALLQCTTKPEELAAGARWFMGALRPVGVDPDRAAGSLLLGLRFAALVLEEARQLASGVAARGLDFRELGLRGSAVSLASVARRFFSNLVGHSSEVANAMLARGYRPNASPGASFEASSHLRPGVPDALVLSCLLPLIYSAFF